MTDREQRAAFSRGIRQFNARRFWHSHESWEAIWLTAPEPDKTFLQGIIQIAAAFYHYQMKNHAGMRSLMRRGLAKVEEFPADYRGLRLEKLRLSVREWLAKDYAGEALPRRYPQLDRGKRSGHVPKLRDSLGRTRPEGK